MTAPSLLEAKNRTSWTFNLHVWRDKATSRTPLIGVKIGVPDKLLRISLTPPPVKLDVS
jgi:hypothetical protein